MDQEGEPVLGETLVYLLNAGPEPVDFVLPSFERGLTWVCLLETADARREQQLFAAGETVRLADHSVAVFLGAHD